MDKFKLFLRVVSFLICCFICCIIIFSLIYFHCLYIISFESPIKHVLIAITIIFAPQWTLLLTHPWQDATDKWFNSNKSLHGLFAFLFLSVIFIIDMKDFYDDFEYVMPLIILFILATSAERRKEKNKEDS